MSILQKFDGIVEMGERDEFTKNLIRAVLYNIVGSIDEQGIHTGIKKAWEKLAYYLSELVRENKEEAFKVAVAFICMPGKNDAELEWKYQYLRGNGLALISDEKLIPLLNDFLKEESREAMILIDAIMRMMDNSEISIWSKEKCFSRPEFYAMVAAIKVGIALGEPPQSLMAEELTAAAKNRLAQPRTIEQVRWYYEIEDTYELAQYLDEYYKNNLQHE